MMLFKKIIKTKTLWNKKILMNINFGIVVDKMVKLDISFIMVDFFTTHS